MLPQLCNVLGSFGSKQTGQLDKLTVGQSYCCIAKFQGKFRRHWYVYTYIIYISRNYIYILYISSESIYKLYLRMCVCMSLYHSLIMKAPNETSTPLKVNGRPRDAIQIIREMKHPELHWYINHNCFWNILKWSIFLVRLALSGFHRSLMILHLHQGILFPQPLVGGWWWLWWWKS